MNITLIAAVSSNLGIGKDNQLLFRIREDMARFKFLTEGNTVIMGRKTWESLPDGFRPLPYRDNIVVTRNRRYSAPGGGVAHSFDEALLKAAHEDVYVIGGAELYQIALPYAKTLELTEVEGYMPADAFFPQFNQDDWDVVFESGGNVDRITGLAYRFKTYRLKD